MSIVVSDTGPILHLKEADLLHLLAKVGYVFIPKAVDTELSILDSLWKDQKPKWLKVKELPIEDKYQAELLYNSGMLGPGESESIILAKCIKADWLLTDDVSARLFANIIGLEVHGSFGILLWASVMGYLQYNEAKQAINRLANTSLWISQSVLEKVYKALDAIFN